MSIQHSNWNRPVTPTTRSTPIAKQGARAEAAARAVEDYLKVIYGHTEWQPNPISPSQLAARLGLVPSTVTEMVKKLVDSRHVEHAPYGAVQLTASGRSEALRMVRRHRLVETWLVQQYGYAWDEVHDEAEVLEHALSDRLLEAIDVQLGHPEHDPHGDPIPDRDGTVRLPDAVQLSSLAPGGHGRVARISDRHSELLREMTERGIALGSVVGVDDVSADLADAIWVVHPAVSSDLSESPPGPTKGM